MGALLLPPMNQHLHAHGGTAPHPARTLCGTRGAGLRCSCDRQLLTHGKVFSGRPALLDRSPQPSRQRSRSIRSVAFAATTLCPETHERGLWRGQLPAPSHRGCGTLLQPGLAAEVQTLHSARPRRPRCDARPGDAPATRLFPDSEREAERFAATLEKHLGSHSGW